MRYLLEISPLRFLKETARKIENTGGKADIIYAGRAVAPQMVKQCSGMCLQSGIKLK